MRGLCSQQYFHYHAIIQRILLFDKYDSVWHFHHLVGAELRDILLVLCWYNTQKPKLDYVIGKLEDDLLR
jgi:hypothetical protein